MGKLLDRRAVGKMLETRSNIRAREPEAQGQEKAVFDIVGCGAVTTLFHVPALKWLEIHGLARIRYCIDPDFQAASSVTSRFRGAQAVVVSSPAHFDGTGAAIVLVATPPEYHAEWAQHYVEVGAHALVEKPAVLTTEQFSLLMNIAHTNKRSVLVGYVRRLFPSVNAARDAIMSGDIGAVRRIEIHAGLRWSWTTRSDFPIKSTAGGVIYDVGSHVLDMALFICGIDDIPPDEVAVAVSRMERWPEHEPSHEMRADFVLRVRGVDVPVALRLSRREALANVVRVRGDNGELLVSVWYGRTLFLRTNRISRKITAQVRSAHTTSAQGCFVAEHLEAWRAWAQGESDSPLALSHFGLLTRLLQTLATGV